MVDDGFIREGEMKGLTLGAGLGPEVTSREICPQCPFKTGFCTFLISLWLEHPDTLGFVCRGMRAWVTKGN